MGTEVAFACGLEDKILLSITLGLLTGVGGGVIRDVLVDEMPYILKKHVYALVSIAGSVTYFVLRRFFGESIISLALPVIIIVILRMLAAKFRWGLPKVHIYDTKN